jgi:hypothetical protein
LRHQRQVGAVGREGELNGLIQKLLRLFRGEPDQQGEIGFGEHVNQALLLPEGDQAVIRGEGDAGDGVGRVGFGEQGVGLAVIEVRAQVRADRRGLPQTASGSTA